MAPYRYRSPVDYVTVARCITPHMPKATVARWLSFGDREALPVNAVEGPPRPRSPTLRTIEIHER